MGRKSRRKKSAAPAATTQDAYVETALREAWKLRYPPSDEDVAEQEVDLMKARGHCCYAALQQGVQEQHFDGVSNFLVMPEYIQVATEALENLHGDVAFLSLVESQQETHKQMLDTPSLKVETHKDMKGKSQVVEASARKGKAHTTMESEAFSSESAEPELQARQVSEENANAGAPLMNKARQKAQQEMAAEYNYAALCEQGRRLYQTVLIDKTKRIYNKMRYREKKRASQP